MTERGEGELTLSCIEHCTAAHLYKYLPHQFFPFLTTTPCEVKQSVDLQYLHSPSLSAYVLHPGARTPAAMSAKKKPPNPVRAQSAPPADSVHSLSVR